MLHIIRHSYLIPHKYLELSTNLREVFTDSQCLEKAPTRVYSLFKASTRAFAIKNLWRHCAEQVLKLGRRHNKDQNQRMAFRIFANQTAHWLWSLHWHQSRGLLRPDTVKLWDGSLPALQITSNNILWDSAQERFQAYCLWLSRWEYKGRILMLIDDPMCRSIWSKV